MQVIFDNIIFTLQRAGGISVVWKELLSRAVVDNTYTRCVLDYPSNNICRNTLDFSLVNLISLPQRLFERYREPHIQASTPSVFHSSYFRISSVPGIRNITTIHDLTYHFYRNGPARWAHLWEERHAIRASDAIICVSEHTRRDLLHIYPWLNENRISVIHNGVSTHFMPKPSVCKQGYLLYVGNRQVRYKQFRTAIEVARLSGLDLVAVGEAASAKEQYYLSTRLGKHFRIVANASNEQLCQYYNEALCLIYPSDYEGFGIPIIEAQRCGCPVIAQQVSSIPEVAGNAGILVQHASSDKVARDMADIVKQLMHGRINSDSIAQAGFQNTRRFSWDRTYQKTLTLYKSVAEL